MHRLACSMVLCGLASVGCGSTVVYGGGDTGGGDVGGGNVIGSNVGGGGTVASGNPTTTTGTAGNLSTGSGNPSCTLVGTWDGISGIDGSNPSSSASFVFSGDGTWIGGTYGANPVATEFMHGNYSIAGGIMTLNGGGMGPYCAKSVEATYAIKVSDCAHVNLLTETDGCTGGRLWLSASPDGTDLVRRP